MSEDEFWDWVAVSPADVGREVLRMVRLLRKANGNYVSEPEVNAALDEYKWVP